MAFRDFVVAFLQPPLGLPISGRGRTVAVGAIWLVNSIQGDRPKDRSGRSPKCELERERFPASPSGPPFPSFLSSLGGEKRATERDCVERYHALADIFLLSLMWQVDDWPCGILPRFNNPAPASQEYLL